MPNDQTDPLHLLVRRMRPDLVAYFLRRGLAHAEAEDLTQEALARFVRAGYLANAEDAGPKLIRIAKHCWIDYLRSATGSRSGAPRPVTVLDDEALESVADLEPLQDARIVSQQDLAIALRAIRTLPEKCRMAFELSRFEGLPYTAIAARMKISKSAVEKHVSDAIRKISRAVSGGDA